MADITKCSNENCSKKENCYRYMVESCEYRQSYALFEEENCESFIECRKCILTGRIIKSVPPTQQQVDIYKHFIEKGI